jgi:hypothetical protein
MATGRRYNGFTNATNTASTTAPMFTMTGATTVRAKLYEFNSGSDATPADTTGKFAWMRHTANFGTPVAIVPVALDPGDPASLILTSAPGGTAPTITAVSVLYQWAQNGRANFRWVAAPDGEIVMPASTNGLALMAVVTVTAQNYAWSYQWAE